MHCRFTQPKRKKVLRLLLKTGSTLLGKKLIPTREYPLTLLYERLRQRYHRLTYLIELRSMSFVSQESQSPPYIPPLNFVLKISGGLTVLQLKKVCGLESKSSAERAYPNRIVVIQLLSRRSHLLIRLALLVWQDACEIRL